nr:ubiquitin carboxyl terminal hydrolase 5 [Hymenolepis microstoma]
MKKSADYLRYLLVKRLLATERFGNGSNVLSGDFAVEDRHSAPCDPEPQPKKLAIGVPGGFELPRDKYDVIERWNLFLYPDLCSPEIPNPKEHSDKSDTSHLAGLGLSSKLTLSINHIQRCDSALLISERESAAQTWEAENLCPVSKYAENLVQLHNGVKVPPSGNKCHKCDLVTNLWMNLSDGTISCGRRFWDGSGGNNHAIEHYECTKYPLAVKLGTITPTSAEVFSYPENDMVTDPLLSQHLAHFGIDMQKAQKNDQTVMELEIAANERLGEWLTLQESDKTLQPLYGPGLTGLSNLGNSCYINAAIQVIFSTDFFRKRYTSNLPKFVTSAIDAIAKSGNAADAVNFFGLQMSKLGQALCSGAYSFPAIGISDLKSGEVIPRQPGIRPRMFRNLIGSTCSEFATNQQKDVQEFLAHLFDLVEREVKENKVKLDGPSPLSSLTFMVEERLECGSTHKVQYKEHVEQILRLPIPLEAATNVEEVAAFESRKHEAEKAGASFKEDPVYLKIGIDACISSWAAQNVVSDFISPVTEPPGQRTVALQSSRLSTFPDLLCIQMLKFTLDDKWVPHKLNVAIQLDPNSSEDGRPRPEWRLDLSALKSPGGLQPGEVLMSSDVSETSAQTQSGPAVDESVVELLQTMGFSRNACVRACMAMNSNVEEASNWLMEHIEDSNLNDPIQNFDAPSSVDCLSVDPGALNMLLEMGIAKELAQRALEVCGNRIEEAINMAFTNPAELLSPVQTLKQQGGGSNARATDAVASKESLSDGDPSRYELIAFISHMGRSTAAGHYVCHIKRSALCKGIPGLVPACEPTPCRPDNEDEWVIFNDEKVCQSESPPFQHAYLYFFRRA